MQKSPMMRIAAPFLTIAMLVCMPLATSAQEVVVNAVGDIMLAGRWAAGIKKRGFDSTFRATADELAKGDINLANLESPIASGGTEFKGKRFRFRAEPEVAQALAKAGFHLVTLANNHSMDFGVQALAETIENLTASGIAWVGAGENLSEARKMTLYTVRGVKVAFLGFSLTQPVEFFAARNRPGTTPGLENIYTADIARARAEADYVIVTFHWGKEGSTTVQPYQRNAAHKAIEAGADAVIGHHPHVLQGVERYRNGIIFYSLGNFAFASIGNSATSSAIVRLRLDDAKREAEIVPLDVLNSRVRFQPKPLSGNRAKAVIDQLNRLSQPFDSSIVERNGMFIVDF